MMGVVAMLDAGETNPTEMAPTAMRAAPRKPVTANSATSDVDDSTGRLSTRGRSSEVGAFARSAAATRSVIAMGSRS